MLKISVQKVKKKQKKNSKNAFVCASKPTFFNKYLKIEKKKEEKRFVVWTQLEFLHEIELKQTREGDKRTKAYNREQLINAEC